MYTNEINLPYDIKISKVKTIVRYARKAELRQGSDTTDAPETSRRNEAGSNPCGTPNTGTDFPQRCMVSL